MGSFMKFLLQLGMSLSRPVGEEIAVVSQTMLSIESMDLTRNNRDDDDPTRRGIAYCTPPGCRAVRFTDMATILSGVERRWLF